MDFLCFGLFYHAQILRIIKETLTCWKNVKCCFFNNPLKQKYIHLSPVRTFFFFSFISNWRFQQNTATGCCSAPVLWGIRQPARSADDRPSSPSAPTRTKTSQTACLFKTPARPTTSAGMATEGLARAWEGAWSLFDVPFETKKRICGNGKCKLKAEHSEY